MRLSCGSTTPGVRAAGTALVALLALFVGGPQAARGQTAGDCDVPYHGGLRWITTTSISGESRIFYYQTPIIRCDSGVRIRADSARVYDATNYTQLWGNVEFQDEDSKLTADQAQYFSEVRRLTATGNAVLTNEAEGSVITGHNMVLIRAGPEGGEDDLTVTGGQPHATLFPTRREEPEPGAPEEAVGDTVPMDTARALPPLEPAPADTVPLPVLSPLLNPEVRDALSRPVSLVFRRHVFLPGLSPVPLDTRGVSPRTEGGAGHRVRVVFGRTLVIPGLPNPGAPLSDTSATVPAGEDAPPPTPDQERAGAQALPEQEAEPEAERTPYEIDARRFVLEGNRYFRASGSVVVTRDSLTAVADSLEYDQDQGAIFLHEDARVTTAKTDLSAETIRLAVPEDEIKEARAVGRSVLDGEDLTLVAPIVTLFFTDGVMDRLVAVRDPEADSIRAEMDEQALEQERIRLGAPPLPVRDMGLDHYPERPHALAQDFALNGDSLDVRAPGETLEEVWAMGGARGESAGRDSLNIVETPELIRHDWLEGDTIIAYFGEPVDSAGTVDVTAAEPEPTDPPPEDEPLPALGRDVEEPDSDDPDYQLERLVARVAARSMYRMAPSDSTVAAEPGRFAIHYVTGDEITILLNEAGEAERMEVIGQTRGIHLEPQGGSVVIDSIALPDTAAADTTGSVPPDTAGVAPPDTAAVAPPDTIGVAIPGTARMAPEATEARIPPETPARSRRAPGWVPGRGSGG